MLQDAIRTGATADILQSVRLRCFSGIWRSTSSASPRPQQLTTRRTDCSGTILRTKTRRPFNLWLELMVDARALWHLHLKQAEPAQAVLSAAYRVLEARGAASLWPIYYRHLAWQRALASHWRIDDEVIAMARKAVAAATSGGDDPDIYGEKGRGAIAWATLYLGWFLLMRGDLEEAEDNLQRSLVIAEGSGDILLLAGDLYCLEVVGLRRHDHETVRRIAPEAEAAALLVGLPEMASVAKGCRAWLAWQDEDLESVLKLADEAAAHLQRPPVGLLSIWKWTYLWPVIAVHLHNKQVGKAVEAGNQMLEPPQQRLPDELEATLKSARTAWASKEVGTAKDLLYYALELAHGLHFF